MKINLVVYVLFFYIDSSNCYFSIYFSYGPFLMDSSWPSLRASSWVLSYVSVVLFTKGKFLTNSFMQSKVNIIYSDISWASSIKT